MAGRLGCFWPLMSSHSVPMTGAGTGASPFVADGLSIVVSGSPASSDQFLLKPLEYAAGSLTLQVTQTNDVAAAAFAGVNLVVVQRQRAAHTLLLLAGALAWLVGGLLLGLFLMLHGRFASRYRTQLTWRPRWAVIRQQLKVGIPIGVMYGADVLGMVHRADLLVLIRDTLRAGVAIADDLVERQPKGGKLDG